MATTLPFAPPQPEPALDIPRPTVVQLTIKERAGLLSAYIPLFTEGGIFVPTTKEFHLGDDLYVLLTLPGDAQRYAVSGKVAWINPGSCTGHRSQGVGVRFPNDERSRDIKTRIEELLGSLSDSDRPTQTL